MAKDWFSGESDANIIFNEWRREDSMARFIDVERDPPYIFDIDLVDHNYKKVLLHWEAKVIENYQNDLSISDPMSRLQHKDESKLQAQLASPLYLIIIVPDTEVLATSGKPVKPRDIKLAGVAPYKGDDYNMKRDLKILSPQELAEEIARLRTHYAALT